MKSDRLVAKMFVTGVVIWGSACAKCAAGTVPKFHLSFKNTASGGSLVLAQTRNRDEQYVSIVTSAGESAASVAHRLGDAVNAWNAAPPAGYIELWSGRPADVNGPTLTLPYGYWALAGTETGLGIPKPPLSLSCSYDKANDKIHLRWINPPEGYDSVRVRCFSTKARRVRCSKVLRGTTSSLAIDRGIIDVNEFDAHVIGYRDGVPSNSAAVRLSQAGCCQSEIYGIPFADGVAPNWSKWSSVARPNATAFEQRKKYEAWVATMYTLLGKTFYQVIKVPPPGVVHGMSRKFLGLSPSHTYRLTAAVDTLKMDSVKGNWEFAVCATPNRADGNDLTPEQLAGLAALPDASIGAQAGRIGHYGPRNTTRGIWEVVLSEHKAGRRPAGSHITLPAGADSITVWVRFGSDDPNGEVAFAGVKLEDLTAAGGKVPAPEEVIAQERTEQAELRVGDAWLKERAARSKNAE